MKLEEVFNFELDSAVQPFLALASLLIFSMTIYVFIKVTLKSMRLSEDQRTGSSIQSNELDLESDKMDLESSIKSNSSIQSTAESPGKVNKKSPKASKLKPIYYRIDISNESLKQKMIKNTSTIFFLSLIQAIFATLSLFILDSFIVLFSIFTDHLFVLFYAFKLNCRKTGCLGLLLLIVEVTCLGMGIRIPEMAIFIRMTFIKWIMIRIITRVKKTKKTLNKQFI